MFLELGQRPDEPGPPIARGRRAYPAEVTARLAADAATIIARYPQARSALLPLLHLVQSEDGYLTPAGIAFCASQLGLTDAEVTAVATFYSMYRRTPTGDYLVGVCTNTLCAIMGGDAILEALEDHLGVHAGETTADGRGHPRAHRVQRRLRLRAGRDGQLGVLRQPNTVVSASELVDALRDGPTVTPTRGAPLCTLPRDRTDPRPGLARTTAPRIAADGAGRRDRHAGRAAGRPRTRPWTATAPAPTASARADDGDLQLTA